MSRTPKGLIAAIVLLGGIALLLLADTARHPTALATLGSGWQCSRTAFVLTTCIRNRATDPMIHTLQDEGSGAVNV
jgi:hypothetical protein